MLNVARSRGRFTTRLALLGAAVFCLNALIEASAKILIVDWDIQISAWSAGTDVEDATSPGDGTGILWRSQVNMNAGGDVPTLFMYPFTDGTGTNISFERVGD